jgi:hypothetical protein
LADLRYSESAFCNSKRSEAAMIYSRMIMEREVEMERFRK